MKKNGYGRHNKLFVILGVVAACIFSAFILRAGLPIREKEFIVIGPESGDQSVWDDYPDNTEGQWRQQGRSWRYFNPDGTQMKKGIHKINGEIYCFDNNQCMRTGRVMAEGLGWLYFQEDGAMARNMWYIDRDRKFHYIQGNGIMAEYARLRSDEEGIYYDVDMNGVRHYSGVIEGGSADRGNGAEKGRCMSHR